MLALAVGLYAFSLVSLLLAFSARAANRMRWHAAECIEYLAMTLTKGLDEFEKRFAEENFKAAQAEYRRCRALAFPWLFITKGIRT